MNLRDACWRNAGSGVRRCDRPNCVDITRGFEDAPPGFNCRSKLRQEARAALCASGLARLVRRFAANISGNNGEFSGLSYESRRLLIPEAAGGFCSAQHERVH